MGITSPTGEKDYTMKAVLLIGLLTLSVNAMAITTLNCAPVAAGASKLIAADQVTADKLETLKLFTCSSPTVKRWVKNKQMIVNIVAANAFSAGSIVARDAKRLEKVK